LVSLHEGDSEKKLAMKRERLKEGKREPDRW
jgi:hypothetical protein